MSTDQQWTTLFNLLKTNFLPFILSRISENDPSFNLFIELANSNSSIVCMNQLNELCDGCVALRIERNIKHYETDLVGQQLKLIEDLIDMFGPKYDSLRPTTLNNEELKMYYIRRNYRLIAKWKSLIYEKFGNEEYKNNLPKEFRKFPLK